VPIGGASGGCRQALPRLCMSFDAWVVGWRVGGHPVLHFVENRPYCFWPPVISSTWFALSFLAAGSFAMPPEPRGLGEEGHRPCP
jgi:hypothetical protein